MIQDVLVEELQDLLHAEGQLVKALPKMAKAANSEAAAPRVRNAPRRDAAARWSG